MEIWRNLFGPRCSSNEVINLLSYKILNKLFYLLSRSLEGFSNFVSVESKTSIASLVLNFDVDEIGKTVANFTVYDFVNNYQGDNWGHNGPGVITRTLQKICEVDIVSKKCSVFNLINI